MPELFDGDGKAYEGALTAEEVEEKLIELKEAASKEAEEKVETVTKEYTEKITTLETSITDLNEQLDKVGDKDFNFARLRKDKEKLEAELAAHKDAVDKKVDEIVTAGKQDVIDKEINRLSGGDDELKKKIEHFYGKLSPDIDDRLDNAYLLATGGNKPATQIGSFSAQSGGYPPSGGVKSTGKLGDEAKNMGKQQLGLSDEDFKTAEEQGLI